MPTISLIGVSPVCSDAGCIDGQAVMERPGVRVHDGAARALLIGARIQLAEGDYVRFPPQVLEQALKGLLPIRCLYNRNCSIPVHTSQSAHSHLPTKSRP